VSTGAICVRQVEVARPDETVLDVARRMAKAGVGTVVVVAVDSKPLGILTDRDIAVRCVAQARDPAATAVSAVMTAPPTTIHESTPIETALSHMAGAHVRRLVVVDDDKRLVGILALDDVLELLAEEAASIGRLLGRRAAAR
jgi:CBS domain-containing protein